MSLDVSRISLSAKEFEKASQSYKNGHAFGLRGGVLDVYKNNLKEMKALQRDAWMQGYLKGYNEYHERKHKKE